MTDSLKACGVHDRASVHGPPLRIGPRTAVALAMALHELCTNAIKYGALSVDRGRVAIRWTIRDSEPSFRFSWQESGGPPVSKPPRRGFGSRLIERALASELQGKASLEFRAEGVLFTLDAALPS